MRRTPTQISDVEAYATEVRGWLTAWMIDLDGVETKADRCLSWSVSNLLGINFEVSLSFRENEPLIILLRATAGSCPKKSELEFLRWMAQRNLALNAPIRLGLTENGVVKAVWFVDSTIVGPEHVYEVLARFMLETREIAKVLAFDFNAGPLLQKY